MTIIIGQNEAKALVGIMVTSYVALITKTLIAGKLIDLLIKKATKKNSKEES